MPLPRLSIYDFTPQQIETIRGLMALRCEPIPYVGCTVYNHGGAHDGKLYSKASFFGKLMYVHRVNYELHTGQRIAPGLLLDHRCRWHPCIDPLHLEPVTTQINTHRGNAVLFSKVA